MIHANNDINTSLKIHTETIIKLKIHTDTNKANWDS